MIGAENSDAVYLVAGCKPWNHRVFDEIISKYPGRWHFTSSPDELTSERTRHLNPRYIFFLHWSWRVPQDLIESYECVCFHMTDVPYGRGGSPLQNLIARGHRSTKLTALKMTQDIDAGPVYLKEALSLEGGAEEIYVRAAHLSARMIGRIIQQRPQPLPQEGEVELWKRRTPSESEIPELTSLQELFDFVRMLDAEGYPKAFITHRGFRYEFNRAAFYQGRIVADVIITRVEGTKE